MLFLLAPATSPSKTSASGATSLKPSPLSSLSYSTTSSSSSSPFLINEMYCDENFVLAAPSDIHASREGHLTCTSDCRIRSPTLQPRRQGNASRNVKFDAAYLTEMTGRIDDTPLRPRFKRMRMTEESDVLPMRSKPFAASISASTSNSNIMMTPTRNDRLISGPPPLACQSPDDTYMAVNRLLPPQILLPDF